MQFLRKYGNVCDYDHHEGSWEDGRIYEEIRPLRVSAYILSLSECIFFRMYM